MLNKRPRMRPLSIVRYLISTQSAKEVIVETATSIRLEGEFWEYV